MHPWKKVLCTHEEPQVTSLGPWPGDDFLGVALPCFKALRLKVEVRYKGKIVIASIWDVGPWAIDDCASVFGEDRPRAEIYKGRPCPRSLVHGGRATLLGPDGKPISTPLCNGAGIDIFPGTARALEIKIGHNVDLEWRLYVPPETV